MSNRQLLEGSVRNVIRMGLALSSLVVLAGLVLQEAGLRHLSAGTSITGGAYPTSLSGMLAGLGRGSGSAVLELGLGLLVLTPIAGVATAVVSYLRSGERRLAEVGAGVLSVLVVSCLVGLRVL